MSPYAILSSSVGTAEAAALCVRLTAWHDAMVTHERRLRTGRTADACDDECPHDETRNAVDRGADDAWPPSQRADVPAVTRERCFSLAAGSCDSNPWSFPRLPTAHHTRIARDWWSGLGLP